MKLKNIFLTFLSTIAITACTSEEIIDNPDITKSQEVPSVLVLGADMGEGLLDTKTEPTEGKALEKGGVLYALVFSAEGEDMGKLLGAGKSNSADENKKTILGVIDGINKSNVYVDINNPGEISGDGLSFDANEVVISGFKMGKEASKKVNVLLIANPVENERIQDLEQYVSGISSTTLSQYKGEHWALALQDNVLFDKDNRSSAYSELTASQFIEMTLYAGVNYVGAKNSDYNKDPKKWFHSQVIDVPLYRLVSDIHLTIKNEIKENNDIEGGTFTVTSILPGEYYYSSCVPDNAVNANITDETYKTSANQANNSYYNYWCQEITLGAIHPNPWTIQIYDGEIAHTQSYSMNYCAFEAGIVDLKIKGNYVKDGHEVQNVTYTYTFPTVDKPEKGQYKIRRNKIYNVTLTLRQAPNHDGAVINIDKNVTLEIADMINNDDYNVSFGQ